MIDNMTAEPASKLSKLKEAAAGGNWILAISIASKFHELGAQKDAIMKAREACCRPDFQRQIGRDPAMLIGAGIVAIKVRYNV